MRTTALLAAAGVALAVSGCAGSSRKATASTGHYGPASSPAALSRCMRANGVSGFPDPIAGPSGAVGLPLSENADGSLTAEGQTFAGPALRTAERVCAVYLPPAGGPPPPVSAEQQRQALAFARCMRAHGVPNFPDPTYSGGPPAGPPAGINAGSPPADQQPVGPAFRSAIRVCGAGGRGNIASPG